MARKLRIQYPGALYHVVNRGNYRQALFGTVGAAQAFLGAVEEAVQRWRWRMHAYVVMTNHFHLVFETPEPTLIHGMHWLESTFATRFNRYRSEQGHVFQGRYYSGLIEDFRYLGHVVDYVHLNPVRAGLVTAAQAGAFRWSSLRGFIGGQRMPGLTASDWLSHHGCLDTPEGWRGYQAHLEQLAANVAEQKRLGWDKFSYGWAIGSEAWKKSLAKEHGHHRRLPGLEASVVYDLLEAEWSDALTDALTKAGHAHEELALTGPGEPWKLSLAQEMRDTCGVQIAWLAKTLNLGSASAARGKLAALKKSRQGHALSLLKGA